MMRISNLSAASAAVLPKTIAIVNSRRYAGGVVSKSTTLDNSRKFIQLAGRQSRRRLKSTTFTGPIHRSTTPTGPVVTATAAVSPLSTIPHLTSSTTSLTTTRLPYLDLDDPENRRAIQSFVDALSLLSIHRTTIVGNDDDDNNNTTNKIRALSLGIPSIYGNVNNIHQNEKSKCQHRLVLDRLQKVSLSTREIDEGTDTTVPETDHAQSTTEQRRTDHQGDDEKLSSSNPVSSAIATTSTSKDAAVNERDAWSDQLRRDLLHSTRQHNLKRSLELYDIAKQNNVILTRKVISDLFFDVSYVDPIRAFSILQDYNSHPSTDFKNLTMYKRICTSVSLLDPSTYRARHMNQFIESLLDDVDDMDDDAKNQLYPNLVITLATQRRVSLGRHAGMLYEYMKENGFDFQLSWLIKVLSLSKYNRQEDLPFHDVMAEYAARGGTRVPAVILPAIHNMFPYTDVEQMTVVLRSYLQIEMNASVEAHHHHRRQNEHFVDSDGKKDNETEDDMVGYATQETDHLTQASPSSVYSQPQGRLNDNHLKIDMSTIEMISAGAARAGNSELVMLVWDVMEHCQYVPTEAIYENTILSFAAEGRRRLRQVFSVMASMKDVGFVPSRPLIRSLCFLLRSDKRLINEALRIILNEDEDNNDVSELPLLSLESLNVILSCLAERGDTSDTLELLRMFKAYDIQPNEDSYSFAMESLGKEIHRLQLADPTNEHNFTCIQENLQLAGSLLTEMEENGLTPSTDVVRNYLELLCLANEVGTATAVIDDLLGGDFRDRVSNKSIYRVAVANVDVGNFDKAEELAGKTSEFIPILHRKIKSQRERSDWLQSRQMTPNNSPIRRR